MKRIFISHPLYSEGDPGKNFNKVEAICKSLTREDILPISPIHQFAFINVETKQIRENILAWCRYMIQGCDELWYYGDQGGCAQEIRWAEQNRIRTVDMRG